MSFETIVILAVISFHVASIHWNIRDAAKNIINKVHNPIFTNQILIVSFLATIFIVGAMYLIRYLLFLLLSSFSIFENKIDVVVGIFGLSIIIIGFYSIGESFYKAIKKNSRKISIILLAIFLIYLIVYLIFV